MVIDGEISKKQLLEVLAAIGTHDELIARPGQYARMWEAQAEWYKRA